MHLRQLLWITVVFVTTLIHTDNSKIYGKELTAQQEATLREAAKNRQRRLIFNNDGNEPFYLCKKADPQELLIKRTIPLLNTQVDSIFYCTTVGSFGVFTHDTKIGSVFATKIGTDNHGVNRFADNCTKELVDSGNDALRIVTRYCKKNKKEIFWSLRMNDTHDGSGAWYGNVFFKQNKLKLKHREWLVGSKKKRPRYGSWTAVDYGHQEIRDLAFRYIEEVCQNYDVDGVELDFFRHPVFFKKAAHGTPCTQVDRDKMTKLIQRIHQMTKVEGMKRGRPILLSIRVPDSVEFCRTIGIDLELWLKKGYADLLITSGYFKLNKWQYSVKLGHKYGVKVYPSLSDSRVRDASAKKHRQTKGAYLARAANVWNAGADGVYIFNYSDLFRKIKDKKRVEKKELYTKQFNSKSMMLKEMGSVKTLRGLNKTYFASIRGLGAAAGKTIPHKPFMKIATLNPYHSLSLKVNKKVNLKFECGEDFTSAKKLPKTTLTLDFKNVSQDDSVAVVFNGVAPKLIAKKANQRVYKIIPTQIRKGSNQIEVALKKSSEKKPSWADMYLKVEYRKAKSGE